MRFQPLDYSYLVFKFKSLNRNGAKASQEGGLKERLPGPGRVKHQLKKCANKAKYSTNIEGF